jgi:hypothetical protein
MAKFAQPFHGTIWLERSGTILRKPLRHSNFDAVPGGTLNPSRQYLKLSLRGRSVPPHLLGVRSGTIGRNSPHHRHASVESRNPAIINSAGPPRCASRRPRSMSTAKTIARSAARVSQRVFVLARRPVTRLETLTSGLPIASNHHIGTPFGPSPKRSDAKQLILLHQSSSRPRFAHSVHRSEGTSARALSAILTLVERKGREGQALGATEALSNGNARMFDIQPEVRGVGGGWPEDQSLTRYST